ncbi:hypothetical protein [Nocardia sp. NPDC050406]|uniref:DUF7373 family lipoprotein n=1 Tax=Nocardia sp. NPDC050406 TaxID=3364318 RepID=UPI0037961502
MGTVMRVVAVCLVAVFVTGCGATISGNPVRQGTSVHGLDVGNYQTTPRLIGHATYDKQARIRESQRLGDFVAVPFEIDPVYAQECTGGLRPHIVVNRKGLGDLVINDTFDDVAADLRAGWVNTWCSASETQDKYLTLNLAVLQFPDAATAARVGPTLEHDDFTYNIDNQPVTLAKYPEARAHWRPQVNSIGVWAVHERFVVFLRIVDDTTAPDLAVLTARAERALEVQLPLLDQYRPTPDAEFATIALDPEGLLGRTLPSDPTTTGQRNPDGVYTGRGALVGLDATSLDFLTVGEVDQIAYGETRVFRSRTAKGALALWNMWEQTEGDLPPNQRIIDAPPGLGEHTVCFEKTMTDGAVVTAQCNFQVDRFNVAVGANNRASLYQQAAAQYVLLTSAATPEPDAAPEPSSDPATLEVGPFPKSPSDFRPAFDSVDEVYNIESRRMLNYLANPFDVDPELPVLAKVAVLEPNSQTFSATGALPAAWLPIAQRHRMIGGVLTGRTNGSLRAAKSMTLAVLRFPSEQAARSAMDEFSSAGEQPGRAPIRLDIPDARAFTIADTQGQAFTVSGGYVVVGRATIAQPDATAVSDRLTSLMRAQLSAMRDLVPTPLTEILDLPRDRDAMMRLALPKTADSELSDTLSTELYGLYDAAARLHFEQDAGLMRKVFADTGVDLVAHHVGTVYRARDHGAAVRLQEALTVLGRNDELIANPPGIPNARCMRLYDDEPLRDQDFRCAVVYDRYVAVVGAQTLGAARMPQTFYQQVAAQYSILTQAG